MTKLNQRGDLNAAALGIYIPILAGAIFAVFRHGITKSTGFAFVVLFCLIKLVGAAMSVDVQLNNNADLYTPAAILSTVVLSPLLLATAHFMKSSGGSSGGSIGRHGLLSLPRITQLMVIASLALGIVGGLDAFKTVPTNIKTGQLYLRVAAGLSVGSWLLIGVSLFTKWSERQFMDSLHKALLPVIGGIIMPLLGLRLAYTCGIAITIDTTMNQEFNALTGSWVLYLCVAWLPEIFIGATYVAVGIAAPRTLGYTGLAENRVVMELV